MNTKFYFPILALALSVAACNDKKAATQTGGIDVANLDRSVTPNQDFYQFACGGWMQAHPLTDEYGRFGSFDLLAENNRKQMQGLIEELAAKKPEPGSVARKSVICIIWLWIPSSSMETEVLLSSRYWKK